MNDLSQAQVQRIYRLVSGMFVAAVLIVGAGVAYTGWSATTITITPLAKSVTTTFPVSVVPAIADADQTQLVGTVTTEKQSATITVEPSGEGAEVAAHATGTMTILNTTSNDQPLAATTRLRADNGVIVRTTKRVDVPAGGQVDVAVTADPLGAEGNLPPGKFIIVALWPGLQSSIYGQLGSAMTGGLVRAGSTLSLDQLTKASDDGLQQIRDQVGASTSGTFIDIQPASVATSPDPDQPSASYAITVTATVTTIIYSADRLQELLQTELKKNLEVNTELNTVSEPTLSVVERPTTNTATLSIVGRGLASLHRDNQLFQPAAYTSLSADAIQKKLLASGLIQTVEVKIAPLWRTVAPDNPQRISLHFKSAVTPDTAR